jgi:putative endonuclease
MTSSNKQQNKEVGQLGEDLACQWLVGQGYEIIERNYAQKWGEIDIIARETGGIHFVEVKTVSHETKEKLEYAVTHETWRPEEQVTARKLGQIEKALKTWISEHGYTGNWWIDVMALRIVPSERYAVVNFIHNVQTE